MKLIIRTLLALLLILAVIEIGLRLSGRYLTAQELASEHREKGHLSEFDRELPTWYWRQQPGRLFVNQQPEYTYEHQYNSYGFRDREFNSFQNASPKVLVLGDSFIEGYGAPADSSFPALLENLLSDTLENAKVINLGMGGSDVFFNYMDLVDLIDVIDPTHVIMTVNSTDFDDYRYTGGFERFLQDGTTKFRNKPLRNRLHSHFHIARFWYESIKGMDYALMDDEQMHSMIEEAAYAIDQCADSTFALCESSDVSFMLMTYAIYRDICSAGLQGLYIESLRDPGRSYPHLELLEQFRPMIEKPNCVDLGYPMDGHFNSRGYFLMARLALDAILTEHPAFINYQDEE